MMAGTANQINIATREIGPHRGWEFNIRRDDAITNSDMYGYLTSHFGMPMEAVEWIQLARGSLSVAEFVFTTGLPGATHRLMPGVSDCLDK